MPRPRRIPIVSSTSNGRANEWESTQYRTAHKHELVPAVEAFMASQRKQDIADRLQAAHCPAAPLNTVADHFHDPQPRSRGFFVPMEHPRLGRVEVPGSPYGFGEPAWRIRRCAPARGEHTAEVLHEIAAQETRPSAAYRHTPLARVRILSFGGAIAGNYAATLLAELGAEVVKIDPRTRPDMTRGMKWPEHTGAKEPSGTDTSLIFAALARSQRTLSLNMAESEGRDLFKRLLRCADVVLDNFSATVMPRWGLDFDALRSIKPDIIMVSLPGVGSAGPKRTWITYANVIAGLVGLTKMWPGSRAHHDYAGGATGAFAVLAAVARRDLTGKGMRVDLAQSEVGAAMMGAFYLDYAVNGRDAGAAPARQSGSAYSTVARAQGADAWVAIEVEDEGDLPALCAAIGRSDQAAGGGSPTSVEELDRLVQEWTSARSAHQAMLMLQRAGIAAGVVQTAEDLYRDPQLRSRGFIVETRHPDLGPMELPQSPHRLSRSAGMFRRYAPRIGQDNEAVLAEWLRVTPEEVRSLTERNIL